jgi:CubicO group peptidase (beta-lactamase class C family)
MKSNRRLVIGVLFVTQFAGLMHAAEKVSSVDWITGLPEEVGLDSAALVEMFDYVRQHEVPVHSAQIVRHGRMVLDAYFYPYSVEMRHDVASVTKSVTSTLIGLAIQKGFLRDVQQPVLSLFPDRPLANPDERKRRITLEHLLTMQSGWDCGFEPKEARLFEMRRSADWLQFMLDLPIVADPGTRFGYCSGNPHVLSVILSRTTGTNALAFARRELFEPLGIYDVSWPTDSKDNNHGWGDLQLHPRDMAKLGQLFLQRGRWGSRQILSESWVRTATENHVEHTVNKDHYGYAWWVKGDDFPGMFEAVGRGGQRINVWPAKDMVMVLTGGEFEPGDLAHFVLKALRTEQSLPANPEASSKLRDRIISATKPSLPKPVNKAPNTAAYISGKTIRMSTNTFGLRELILKFNGSAEAKAELVLDGHHEHFLLGLDGVERFSPSTLVDLPAASTGEWVGNETFLLKINLVGGINFYTVKLAFSGQSKQVAIGLSERTGLNEEQFSAVVSD